MSVAAVRDEAAISAPSPSPRRVPTSIRALLCGTFLVRAAGFTYPFLSYRLDQLDLSTNVVSRILAAFGVGWFVGQLVCGWLADRVGRRTTLIGAMSVAAMVLPLLAHLASTPAIFISTVIAGAVYDAPRPIVSASIAALISAEEERARINGWRHFAVNVSAALTGFAGGMLAGSIGVTPLIWTNAVACAGFALLAWRYLDADQPHPRIATARAEYRAALGDVRLWLLTLASLAALVCAAGMFCALPLLMTDDGLSATAYGWTQLANFAAVVTLSPVLTPWLSRRAATAPMLAEFAASSLILGAGMTVAGLASTTIGYSLAVVLLVPGEIIIFIAAGNLLDHVAPAEARGLYAGIWGSTLALAVILAPLLTGWALDQGGGLLTAVASLAAGLLGATLILPLTGLMRRQPPVLLG
ncbi:MFS transporter [Streptomyces sp. DH12]|uniref:MFS transporter n=1 Tax=Streptomyces sp. DH12 TaxID=2857010 RepID=UPI001E5D07DB|nr:MFS transporter [Streptomyces sp. DH12]